MLKWIKPGFRDIVSSRILNDSHPLGSFSETKAELQNKSALSSWGWAEIGGVERLKAEILERGCPSQVVTLWCLLVLCVLGDIKVAQPESVSKRRGRKVMVSDQWFYRTSLSVSTHLWMCFLAESFMPLQSFHSLAAAQFTRQHQLAEITAGTSEDPGISLGKYFMSSSQPSADEHWWAVWDIMWANLAFFHQQI